MKETNEGDALSVIGIMEEKGWTKDEIRELVIYLDQSITQPLETMFFIGFGILAFLIMACPGILQRVFSRYFPDKPGG